MNTSNYQANKAHGISKLKRKLGAVLIEFAFVVPVFLALIYYIHDLPKYKLMARKLQFVANETAAIIQNIAKQRADNGETFYQKDLWNASSLAFLSVFPGNTMTGTMKPREVFPLGYFAHTTLMYVVGTNNDEAQGKWAMYTCGGGGNVDITAGENYISSGCTIVFNSSSSPAKFFYPTLKINKGEAKLLVECLLFYRVGHNTSGFTDGRRCKDVSPRQAFKFLILDPKRMGRDGTGFFNAVSIFTPQGGFSASLPPAK